MSVSGLPKLDDFKKAIAEVKAANAKYTTAQNSLKPSQEAIDKAKAALDAAKEKYNSLQNDYNNKSYLNNSTYQSAYNTYNDALNKATSLENYWRSRDWLKSDSGYQNAANAYNTAQLKVQSLQDYINSGKYLQDNSAYQTALNNQKAAEQKLNTARSFLDSEDYLNKNSTYQNYVSAFNTADQKLNQLRDWKDSGRYLQENSTYQNAVNAIPSKIDALRAAESKLDNWTGPRSGTAWNSAVAAKVAADNAVSAAWTARDKASEAASNAADTLIKNQDTIRSTAEQNINKTRDSLRSTAENAVNLAQTAYDATQPAIDKAQSAAQTLAQNNLDIASKALGTAETNKNIAENKADEIAWNNWQTSAKAADTLNTKANDIAKGLESVANKALETQRSAVDAQNGVYETAQNKYNDIYGEIAPDLEDYNSKLANVSNYAQTFKENLGDITSYSDVQAAKTLLDQFNSEIKNIGIDDLKNKLTPVFSDVASTAQFDQKLQQAVADYKKNIELPTLSASQVDNVLKSMANQRIGDGNSLMIPRYQTVGDDFGTKGGTVDGLNLKSVNANILTGSALFGLYKGGSQKTDDFSIADPKVDNVWHSRKATDADFAKAAADAKVDITGMTRQEAYNAINDKWKDYYSITTRGNLVTDPATGKTSDHWNSLYRRDGDNLVPVTDQNGAKVVQGFNATWHTPYEDFGSFLAGAMPAIAMALPFVIPGIGNALSTGLSGLEIAAATAPTAFTVGAPALTLGTAIGSTAVSMAANAVTNAVVTKLLNPNASGSDIATSAAVGAAGTLASSNPSKIVENIGISPDTVNKIAEASKLTPAQVNNIIATGVTKTATSIATGDPNAATNIGATVAGMFVGSEAQNLVADAFKTADPKLLNSAINAAGNVANIVTQTVIKDGDVNAALLNAAPDIITSAVKAGDAAGKTTTPVTIEERSTYPESTPDKYGQIVDAFGNSVSASNQYGDPTAALVGSQVGGKTLSDLAVNQTAGSLPTIFPNGTVQINPNTQYGKIYEATVDGQVVQARDAIRSNGEKVTIYFDPSTGEHASTQLTGNFNLSAPIDQTQKDILATISGGKILDLGSLTSTYKYTPEGDPIVEAPSGKFYALKTDGTNQELNQNDLSKALVPAGKSPNGMPMLQAPDGSLYVANTKTYEIEKANINALFSFGTPPPEVTKNISLAGTGSTSTINEDKFGFIAQDFGTPEEKLQAIANVETWEKQIQDDPKATAEQKTNAAEITKAIKDANVINVQSEVKQPDVTPTEVKPPEVKPTDVKPVTPTTAGGSSTAAPTPELTPQQKYDELQNKADAAQAQVLNAANSYIQNPTVANKTIVDKAVLDAEIAIKMADAAKANITGGDLPQSTQGQPTDQTGSQQTSQPGVQQPAQPGTQQPSQPGSSQPSQTTSTTPGSGTSNLPGDSTSTTTGLGGIGAGGTGTVGTGTSGSGTGTSSGTGVGTDIVGVLSALAGALGGVKTPATGALTSIPAGYTAVTTPLAKRPIGDLYPVSNIMLTPEEQASRASLDRGITMRRGGLAHIR